jgi:hypothetical protein
MFPRLTEYEAAQQPYQRRNTGEDHPREQPDDRHNSSRKIRTIPIARILYGNTAIGTQGIGGLPLRVVMAE